MAPRMQHRASIYSSAVLIWTSLPFLISQMTLSSSLVARPQNLRILEGGSWSYEFVSFFKMSAIVYLCQSSLARPTNIPVSTRTLDFCVNVCSSDDATGEFSKDTVFERARFPMPHNGNG